MMTKSAGSRKNAIGKTIFTGKLRGMFLNHDDTVCSGVVGKFCKDLSDVCAEPLRLRDRSDRRCKF